METIDLFAGVDIGSTSVRLGLIDKDGHFHNTAEIEPIYYHTSTLNPDFKTQSSEEIWELFKKCYQRAKAKLKPGEIIRSISCAATCSMVVMKLVNGALEPYPVDFEFKDKNQNVVFWMDSRASKETQELNRILESDVILDYYGGSFIEEMGIPKVKYLVDHIPKQDLDSLIFFDLHDFIMYQLGKDGKVFNDITISNKSSKRALDGELKGWSSEFLQSVGLGILSQNNFSAIGCLEKCSTPDFNAIPLAGSPIGSSHEGTLLCQGVIDSYAGWLGSCGKDVSNTLTMVAGTSTCYLIGHTSMQTIPGAWGPFEGIFTHLYVSEGGQSTTGKLIEHLFETHPAFKEIKDRPFEILERLIKDIEINTGKSVHYSTKHMFLYGDLSGNRTPYCDGSMRGVFFGESTDTSLNDLVLKYVCILEFLAFQTKQIINLMKPYDIKKIVICGSQAKNKRLIEMISLITGIAVEISLESAELSGVKGAAYLALSGYSKVQLVDVIASFNQESTVIFDLDNNINNSYQESLKKLLLKKYEIMVDIAERQQYYKKLIDETIEHN